MELCALVGVPVIAPVVALRLKPVGRAGDTVQLVLVPPEFDADKVGIATLVPSESEFGE